MSASHDDVMRSIGRIEGKIDSILDQATKTNGRVTRLEESVTTLKVSDGVTNTKMTLIGSLSGVLGGAIVGYLFK